MFFIRRLPRKTATVLILESIVRHYVSVSKSRFAIFKQYNVNNVKTKQLRFPLNSGKNSVQHTTHTHTHHTHTTHTHTTHTHTHTQHTHTHTHTHTQPHTHTHTQHTHTTHLEQWAHTHTHTPGAVAHTHTHTWSSGHTHHTHTWSSGNTHTHGAVGTHTHTHTWSSGHTHTWSSGTHTHTQHTHGAVGTHTHLRSGNTHTHTHLEQWAVNAAAPGGQLGVRCLAQGSHLSRGQFLLEPRTHNLRLQVQRSIHQATAAPRL